MQKICILINWVREIDMYMELIKKIPKKNLLIIINDLYYSEIEKKNNTKEILLSIKKKKLKYCFFSKIYNKKKFKLLLSTGDTWAKKVDLFSILKYIYAITAGYIIEKTFLSEFFFKIFNRPLTGRNLKPTIYRNIIPEKNISDIVIKYPWTMELNKKRFPDDRWKNNFDIFFTHGEYDSKLIKKKFNKSKTMIIGYPRYSNLAKKNFLRKKYSKLFRLKKNKKIIFWIPTHVDQNEEIAINITNWLDKFQKLLKYYNIIIRPHSKTLKICPTLVQDLSRKGFKVDDVNDRKIGELFKLADIVIADYGGSVFSSIYLKKPTLLLNLSPSSKYLMHKKKIITFDLLVRNKLVNLNTNTSFKKILKSCREAYQSKELKKIYLLKTKYFGKNNKVFNTKQVSRFLLKLMKQ